MSRDWKDIIAIGNYHYTAYSFEYFLDSIASLKVKNIEIWGAKPHLCVDAVSLGKVEAMREAIDKKGLKVICFCPEQNTYPVDICARDDDFRSYSIAHMKKAIEITHILGAKRMLLCPGNGSLDEPQSDIEDRFKASVSELLDTAEKNDVLLCLETQAKVDSLFMNTAEDQQRMLKAIDSDYFKAMLDTVQLAQFDSSVRKSLEVIGLKNVRHVHLGNTVVREKTWYEKQAPEGIKDRTELSIGKSVCGHIGFREGNLPLAENLRELMGAGYEDYVTIEICQRPYFFDAHRYAREALEYTIAILDRI